MRNGIYRHLITIQNDTSADGAEAPTWGTFVDNVPSGYYDVAGGETFRGKQLEASVTAVFEIRYYTGVTEEMRIVNASRNFNISKIVDRQGISRYLELHATEIK